MKEQTIADKKTKVIMSKGGKLYFKKETEQRIFFVLTLIMLGLGILSKLGWF